MGSIYNCMLTSCAKLKWLPWRKQLHTVDLKATSLLVWLLCEQHWYSTSSDGSLWLISGSRAEARVWPRPKPHTWRAHVGFPVSSTSQITRNNSQIKANSFDSQNAHCHCCLKFARLWPEREQQNLIKESAQRVDSSTSDTSLTRRTALERMCWICRPNPFLVSKLVWPSLLQTIIYT